MTRKTIKKQKTNFEDVQAFHDKFGLKRPNFPMLPFYHKDLASFRTKFLREELSEFELALAEGDLENAFDALLDLVYVAMGTADLMGLPWQKGWDEVQRANMSKKRAESANDSTRGTQLDVIKPENFKAPDHSYIWE